MSMISRPKEVKFHVSEEEHKIIKRKMEQVGTTCMAAYLRKMALDGYVVVLDIPELRETVTLMRRSSAAINQIAKRVNGTGRLYDEDICEIQIAQEKLWVLINDIWQYLASVS